MNLLEDDPAERTTPELVLAAGDLKRRRAPGPVAV